jgi:hypothetical protein
MTNLKQKVTPLTRGLIWTCTERIQPDLSNYRDIDYLVNGLITASLGQNPELECRVIISESFGEYFYLLMGKNITDKEFENFFNLIKTQLTGENHLLLVDENQSFERIQKLAPSEIKSKILVSRA